LRKEERYLQNHFFTQRTNRFAGFPKNVGSVPTITKENSMYQLIVLPVFLVAVLTGVQSWLWKSLIIVIVGISWFLWGPLSIAIAVAFILGIAVKNSFPKFS